MENRGRRILKTLALLLLLTLVVAGCGKKELVPPTAYTIGADSAPPLDAQLGEGDGLLSGMPDAKKMEKAAEKAAEKAQKAAEKAAKKAEQAAKKAAKEAEKNGEPPPAPAQKAPTGSEPTETAPPEPMVYTYTEMTAPGGIVERYAAVLTDKAQGFTVVDIETKLPIDPPDYGAETGTITLAKNAATAGRLFSIAIAWTADGCVVTVSTPEGKLVPPPVEAMTLGQAVEQMKSLSPSALGLPGESMEDYQVFPVEGVVFVDGHACVQMSVYAKREPPQTGEAGHVYLLSGDKLHLYTLDKATHAVTELSAKVPPSGERIPALNSSGTSATNELPPV